MRPLVVESRAMKTVVVRYRDQGEEQEKLFDSYALANFLIEMPTNNGLWDHWAQHWDWREKEALLPPNLREVVGTLDRWLAPPQSSIYSHAVVLAAMMVDRDKGRGRLVGSPDDEIHLVMPLQELAQFLLQYSGRGFQVDIRNT